MQTKIIFISDHLNEFSKFLKTDGIGYNIDMMGHAEANRRHVFQNYYDLFVIDLKQDWLAIPHWVFEQVQHHYFFQFIFISDGPLSKEMDDVLNVRVFKVIDRATAKENITDLVQEFQVYSANHRFTHLKQGQQTSNGLSNLVGTHSSIKGINKFIEIVSKTKSASCLIRGELGTGKSLCAQLIHQKNELPLKQFIIKNCEGTTTNELLGDLFGVEGETDIYGPKRIGLFEKYVDGTVVLKNIEKLPIDVQNKMLLFLEGRVFNVLGATRIVESNVRIIGTTQHNLEWFVRHQNFNSGLFYRLKAFEIFLPPLRDRREDIEHLSNYYLQYYNNQLAKELGEISPVAMQMMNEYNWPGNIKEVKNIIERAVIISTSNQIIAEDLPANLQNDSNNRHNSEFLGNCSLKELERIHIHHVLVRTNGNKSKAAEILDISRTTLREKMRVYEIEV
ncbi:MAG: sigma-54-dependent Fis family transcriptional regulator [Calditrichaeota bacterium]|nr:MAG: sigma-54-dependent Fis family transcriptional regulator [Calditrichota bacterium]MBL1207606.1 sigma-54-dependent Fis family transcriptional regulator [Calditrichota bacterium]NOG47439.1 sigma-54-dependent Fis family transcriptional regulator [Calditrichota bacterium]